MQCKTHIECTGIKIRPVQQKPTFNSMIQRTDKHSLPLLLINIYNCFIIWNSVMFKLNWAFLVNKTNRCTEFQFYWYYDSTYFGQPFCPSSGVLSHTLALVHFMQLWWPFATRSRMELQFQTKKLERYLFIVVSHVRVHNFWIIKGAIRSQLNWAILLCDVIPDGKTE